jgi:hypothetical protein
MLVLATLAINMVRGCGQLPKNEEEEEEEGKKKKKKKKKKEKKKARPNPEDRRSAKADARALPAAVAPAPAPVPAPVPAPAPLPLYADVAAGRTPAPPLHVLRLVCSYPCQGPCGGIHARTDVYVCSAMGPRPRVSGPAVHRPRPRPPMPARSRPSAH